MKRQKSMVFVILVSMVLSATVASADLARDLLGYWPLDGNARDDSGNKRDGKIVGNVAPSADRFGNPNGAMLFPGKEGNHIALDSFTITGEMTLAAWTRIDSYETDGRIISKQGYSGSRGWSLNVESEANGHVGAFHVAKDGSTIVFCETKERLEFKPDEWFHMAGVYKPGKSMELYINGELNNMVTENIPNVQHDPPEVAIRIGERSAACPMAGSIDDVIVWTRALNANEVRQAMGKGGPFAAAVEPGGKLTTTWGNLKH